MRILSRANIQRLIRRYGNRNFRSRDFRTRNFLNSQSTEQQKITNSSINISLENTYVKLVLAISNGEHCLFKVDNTVHVATPSLRLANTRKPPTP